MQMSVMRAVFFFALLAIVIGVARCNSRSGLRTENPIFPAASATPAVAAATPIVSASAPAPSVAAKAPTPVLDFQKVAKHVEPAVAVISMFDVSGKLIRTVSGCFVSGDGKLVTSSSATHDVANAIANMADGKIYNIAGVMADAAPFDIVVLKTESKSSVPFVSLKPAPLPDSGAHLAIVTSPLIKRNPPQMEVTVAASHTDGANQFVEVMPVVPNDLLGSPVIDEKGELIGVVAAAASPGAPNIVRGTGAVEGLVSRISSNSPVAWAAAPPPPAESPSRPPMRTARIPVVQADRAGNSRLIFSPKPQFPAIGRNSTAPLRGDGRYRISFDASGRARNVQILQPSGSPELDAAATSTLSRWKAAPGQEWNATVPVTFQP